MVPRPEQSFKEVVKNRFEVENVGGTVRVLLLLATVVDWRRGIDRHSFLPFSGGRTKATENTGCISEKRRSTKPLAEYKNPLILKCQTLLTLCANIEMEFVKT